MRYFVLTIAPIRDASEPDRHADMAARKAEPPVKALRINARVVGEQFHQRAAPAARFANRPLHQPFADAAAAAIGGDAHVLDQAARGALRADPGQDAKLQATDHRPALFRDHEVNILVAIDGLERPEIARRQRILDALGGAEW